MKCFRFGRLSLLALGASLTLTILPVRADPVPLPTNFSATSNQGEVSLNISNYQLPIDPFRVGGVLTFTLTLGGDYTIGGPFGSFHLEVSDRNSFNPWSVADFLVNPPGVGGSTFGFIPMVNNGSSLAVGIGNTQPPPGSLDYTGIDLGETTIWQTTILPLDSPPVFLTVNSTLTGIGYVPDAQLSVDFASNPVVGVPGPIAGAGLPGLILVGVGLLAWRRRNWKVTYSGSRLI